MKDKDIIRGEELKKIDPELFCTFDPEDETCIGGDTKTITDMATYSNGHTDMMLDYEIVFEPVSTNPSN